MEGGMSVMWMAVLLLAAEPQRGDGGASPTRVDPFETPAPAPVERVPTSATREVRPLDVNVPASVDVRSEMGKRFRLVEAIFMLDGAEVAHRTAVKGQELERRFRAYDGSVRPGQHALTVTLVYEGRNTGPFTYLDNYKYRVEQTYGFTVTSTDRPAAVEVVAHERKGANIPLDQKPTLDIVATPGSSAAPMVTTPPAR
jgi:hypothetical protein